ncbi:hypothetical protein [Paracoccus beibuensis]|uniref:hypothetical protein n=1 Tax=Paracoccus beibuensis TaxID=547602 RepID=UPI00223FCE14|nr:hypothetical protein [Paracoccus beibuensis]
MSDAAASPDLWDVFKVLVPVAMAVIGGGLALLWRRIDGNESRCTGGLKDLDAKLDALAAKQHEHELASSRSYVQREEFNRVVSNLETKIDGQGTMIHEIHRLVASMKAKLDASER